MKGVLAGFGGRMALPDYGEAQRAEVPLGEGSLLLPAVWARLLQPESRLTQGY
jgi:hypothetical protein